MERQPVISSNVRSIGYDQASNTLEIEFTNAGVYQYLSVPESLYTCLMEANSVGSYFHAHIKKAFQCERIV